MTPAETVLWSYAFAASALYTPAPLYDGGPGSVSLASAVPAVGIQQHTTPFGLGIGVAGDVAPAHGADLYHRVHLSTRILAMGNVIGTQTRDVLIWNAHLYARQVLDVHFADADGIEIESGAVPAALAPLGEYTYTVRVTQNGPPVIDAVLTWILDAGLTLPVAVTGNRVTAWVWLPDWTDPVLERLSWATDVLESYDGTERRRSLRIGPRRYVEWSCTLHGVSRMRLDNTIHGWGARVWARPDVWSGSMLTGHAMAGATALAFDLQWMGLEAGDMLMLHDGYDQSEIAGVLSVSAGGVTLQRPITQTWPTGSRVYRAVPARLDGAATVRYETDTICKITPSFVDDEPADWTDAHGLSLYRGAPVLVLRHDWTETPELALQRKIDLIDNQTGLTQWDDETGRPYVRMVREYLLHDRAAADDFRRLLAWLRGRQGVVWVVSATTDLVVVAPMPGVAVTMDVEWCGYTLYAGAAQLRRDLRIETTTGVYHRRVIAAEEISSTVERITLDSALGVAHDVADFRRISFMVPCRLAADAVEMAWLTDTVARCRVEWIGASDDV